MKSESFSSPDAATGFLGAAADIGRKAAADDSVCLGAAMDVDNCLEKESLGATEDIGGNAAADESATGLGAEEVNCLGAVFDIGGNDEFDIGVLEESFDFDEIKGKAAFDKLDASSDGFDLLELFFFVGEGFEASSASREIILRP